MSIRIFVGVYCSQRMMMIFTRGAQGQICETTSRGPLGRQMLFAKSVYKLFGLLLVLSPSCYPLQQFTTTTIRAGSCAIDFTQLGYGKCYGTK